MACKRYNNSDYALTLNTRDHTRLKMQTTMTIEKIYHVEEWKKETAWFRDEMLSLKFLTCMSNIAKFGNYFNIHHHQKKIVLLQKQKQKQKQVRTSHAHSHIWCNCTNKYWKCVNPTSMKIKNKSSILEKWYYIHNQPSLGRTYISSLKRNDFHMTQKQLMA